jgi:hypothetical protein
LPIINNPDWHTFELLLVERYLMNLKTSLDIKIQNLQDFNFLLYSPRVFVHLEGGNGE